MDKLETLRCIECDKEIKIPLVQPYKGKEKPTGFVLDDIDEDQNSHYMGAICHDCAFRLCNEGKIALGGGGGLEWDATRFGDYIFKFEEKNRQECHCSICDEKRFEEEEEDYN
jgi:hypothetical protein